MKRQFLLFGLFFIALLLLFKGCNGNTNLDANLTGGDLGIAVLNNEYKLNDLVTVQLRNNTDKEITIENDCPREPLNVYKSQNGEWVQLKASPKIICNSQDNITIKAGEDLKISYTSWNHALFHDIGKYKIGANLITPDGVKEFQSNEFTVNGKSWLGYIWGTFLYQPIYNSLIYLVSIVPNYNLGLAIILLTIILRSILFIPSQRGLESQKKLQELQPRIKKLQEKYKNNQEKIAQETFALYKEYKVNPFGSCLPLLLQMPILIGLFYVIRTGLNPDNIYLLYAPLKGFDLSVINSNFLGLLDLQTRNVFALPLIVASLQYFQLKLSMAIKNNNDDNNKKSGKGHEMQMASKMMVYVMPVMIALFTASVPSGVGLYWGTSTVFGILQQLYVNKRVSGKHKKNKAQVRVIEKK
ncbi:YidC/Oxa1 family membrane protein insertase [bacterium]|nr:YidC/Oxa1 family membrane protein insertase [bacterium]